MFKPNGLRAASAAFALVLALGAIPAQHTGAQESEAAATDTTERGNYTRATRFDTTTLKLPDLARLLPSAPAKPLGYDVPNQFGMHDDIERNNLDADPLVSKGQSATRAPAVSQSFPGPSSDDNQFLFGSRPAPPDTNGDVGPSHIVSYINVNWSVYDKTTGARTAGPFAGNSFWGGFGGRCESENQGDAIVLYDHLADQWVFSQLVTPGGNSGIQCFAVSVGGDPLGPYHRYEFAVSPGEFNDYPKIGVWTDQSGGQSAYHYTARQFSLPSLLFFRGIDAGAFERDAMLNGQPAGYINFRIPGRNGADGIMPPHLDGGPAAPNGKCGLYSVANAPGSYQFWEFCVDFNNPNNASLVQRNTLSTASFDDGLGDVPLPGGDNVDTLAFFTHYRFSHRNLAAQGHYATISHTVDVGGDRAGIRWAILDVNNYNNISIVDTGTFGPNDGLERWMGSTTLDKAGNLGLGYTRAGGGQFPSVYVTGRETGDPAGTLQSESLCVTGTGSQTGGTGRWGDYSTTSIDPVDECTFWTIQEYVETTGSRQWNTRVCSFSFPSCAGGQPQFTLLATDPGAPGVNNWTSVNGSANSGTILFIGTGPGTTPVSFPICAGTNMSLAGAFPIGFDLSDGGGSATVTRSLPAGIAGRTLSFQMLDITGCDTSNVTTTTF